LELTRTAAEDFLFHESRLLDERRLEEWLELFTSDGIYWIPLDENADPEREPSILYDDSMQRAQRVYQILHQPHHAQRPPSQTVHFISNVEVTPEDNASALVRCNTLVHELRPGDPQQFGLGIHRALAGRCEYRLRYQEAWRIALKKVLLIDHSQPIFNLTFIL
jgi:3-phenylpropionate/cinnamic acid dioxygenase small subunit